MTDARIAQLEDLADALAEGGYTVELRRLGDQTVLLGETLYALVACMETDDWAELERRVYDTQAELTRFAAMAPSPRIWDLYLFVHLTTTPPSAAEESIAETIEADTHYVRKLVRVAIDANKEGAIDRALRPLLPMRPTPQFDIAEPVELLRRELRELELPDEIANAALDDFQRGKEISPR
jgi:hypothetical protein